MNILSLLKKNPLIYAATCHEEFVRAANGAPDVLFLLKSELNSLKKTVSYAHDRGKKIFVHFVHAKTILLDVLFV